MSDDALRAEVERLRAERDLYRRLLDLSGHDDPDAFLDEALGLLVSTVGARCGYLALFDPARKTAEPRWWAARGMSTPQLEAVRASVSHGIIDEALRAGTTISTASAIDDPRFAARASVQSARIEAVLCAPIGGTARVGVLYVQGQSKPGPFSDAARVLCETFATHVTPLASRVANTRTQARVDHTLEVRARLKADGVAGSSRALAEALKHIAVAAAVDVPVLLQGESGTGKTALARVLHASSRRARGPFIEINCAALPETLFEAELFGAEKGAHSTATRRMPGRIAAAQHGTLFLDEVGEIPLGAQAKLLQFLQSRQYWRLGGDAPVDADVRVITATNVDLESAVRDKTFREDLFYRLHVFPVRVPPLRERKDDVSALADAFAREAGAQSHRELSLSWDARAALDAMEWPGNVRQLASVVQRGAAFAISEGLDMIAPHHLFPERISSAEASPATEGFQDATRRFQRSLLQATLDATEGNVSESARRLGLARSHMHELIRAHGLTRARSG